MKHTFDVAQRAQWIWFNENGFVSFKPVFCPHQSPSGNESTRRPYGKSGWKGVER